MSSWHKFLVKKYIAINDKMEQTRNKNRRPIDGITQFCDIPYFDDGNLYHLLDVYYPKDTQKLLPVIIDIHGGAWIYGTKEINKQYCHDLAKRGFVVVNVNYRVITEECGGTFPNFLIDIFNSFNWVEQNILKYHGDINNIFLTGDSAGAHIASIAMSVCVDKKWQNDLKVSTNINFRGLALTCGVSSLEGFEKIHLPACKYLFTQFLGKDYKLSPNLKLATIKNNNLSAFPPIFLISCYGDFLKKQVFAFHQFCIDNNVPCELFYIEKKEKNKLSHVYNVLFPEYEESIKTNDACCSFFKKNMI